jgi:2-polyprenyl-3-methyl-5-hydroxy-6-metoxy-1,4-benzoquinol methylase
MFGSEYADFLEIPLAIAEENFHKKSKIKKILEPLIKIYVRIFGLPELGLRIRAAHLRRALRDKDFKNILEAGSGIGTTTIWLARRYPLATIDACDIDEKNIQSSEKVKKGLDIKNINFFAGDITKNLGENKYDLICSQDVLEHVEDDRSAINNFFLALKPCGYLVLHLPQKNQLRHFKNLKQWTYETHVREGYTKEEISQMLEKNNFKNISVQETFGRVASWCWEINQILLSFYPIAALFFPLLLFISLVDIYNKDRGNGLLIEAQK